MQDKSKSILHRAIQISDSTLLSEDEKLTKLEELVEEQDSLFSDLNKLAAQSDKLKKKLKN